jgi:hypothetical protein
MTKLAFIPVSLLLTLTTVPASAGEEIQLAAAIGARAIPKPAEEAAKRPEPVAEAASSLSRTAMISIGVGAAVVIGAVAGGSSTTSHN